MIQNDLASVLAIEIDRAGLNGDGTGAEPEGILQNSSVSSVSFGAAAPTYAKMVEFETDVAAANADVGNLAYVTSARRSRQTEVGAGCEQYRNLSVVASERGEWLRCLRDETNPV